MAARLPKGTFIQPQGRSTSTPRTPEAHKPDIAFYLNDIIPFGDNFPYHHTVATPEVSWHSFHQHT